MLSFWSIIKTLIQKIKKIILQNQKLISSSNLSCKINEMTDDRNEKKTNKNI